MLTSREYFAEKTGFLPTYRDLQSGKMPSIGTRPIQQEYWGEKPCFEHLVPNRVYIFLYYNKI